MGRIFTVILVLLTSVVSYAQTSEDVAVELSATVQQTPPQIKLQWKPITAYPTLNYSIFRKAKTATSWGTAIATLTITDSVYADNSVSVDTAYEYEILAFSGSSVSASGYIYAGIRNPAIHNRGTMLLIVDSAFTDSCQVQIQTLMDDLSGDGWQLIRHDFPRTASDVAIKAVINNDYTHNANVKAVLLLGHVAVPYSGGFNATINPPDGHVPQHTGAWPADLYYTCLTGTWTDATVTETGADSAGNRNVPGDGKWDQITMPSPALMEISRIDFYNMPTFTTTEVQMMKSYLGRDHAYKMNNLPMRHRGIISDNFGYFSGEAFAANGWRNFAPMVTKDSLTITTSAFISSLADSTFQWAYATGGGTFTSASGIGSTSDFATNPVNGIFMMSFGSFFGDWNATDNFLRAPLCSSTPVLTNCWAGRPNWFLHHMALGDNIGYGALLTQNNTTLYSPSGYGASWIHVALMGDLSLRTDYILPVSNITFTTGLHLGATINWIVSTDPAVIGYYVYRADSLYGYYQRISPAMVTSNTFRDTVGTDGLKYYMVRPIKLQLTPSGNYYNLGVGLYSSATVSYRNVAVATVTRIPDISLFPNPAQDYLNVVVNADAPAIATMYIVNEAGIQVSMATKQLSTGDNRYTVNIAGMPPGVYTLIVNTGNGVTVKKWVKL